MQRPIGWPVGAVVIACVCGAVFAQQERIKLLPNDGEMGDGFGVAAALSGTTALLGAFGDDDNGSGAGAAYLFDLETGEQLFKLVPDDGAPDDRFGGALAASGAVAVIGSYWHEHNGVRAGAAYVFDLGSGAQLRELRPANGDGMDGFSSSVALRGSVALLGAPGDDDNGDAAGAAYLFDADTGEQIAKLLPLDGAARLNFGVSGALSETTAAVGCWDDDNGLNSGSVYLFDRTSAEQTAKLTPIDGHASQLFGCSIALSGSLVVVGASGDDDHWNEGGAVYLFDVATGEQLAKLRPSDGHAEQHFGARVAVSQGTLLVAATGDNASGHDSGAVYTFDLETWVQVAKLTASDAAEGDNFGISIAADGERILIGATGDEDNGVGSGSAYGFWSCIADLTDDGVVDTLDFLLFLGAWAQGNPLADWDGNGTINTLDFLAYLNDWAAGC